MNNQTKTKAQLIEEMQLLRQQVAQLQAEKAQSQPAEKKTEEDQETYRALFETIPLGVVYQAANGDIISANPAAQRILGLTLEQMQGRTSLDPRWRAIHEDGANFPRETHPAMVALKTGQSVHNVIMGVFNPLIEAHTWININAIPQFRPGETQPYQVYATFEDITERKQLHDELNQSFLYLEEQVKQRTAQLQLEMSERQQAAESLQTSEALYRSLVENLDMGITLIDKNLKIMMSNQVKAKLLKQEQTETPGTFCYQMFAHRTEPCANCPGLQTLQSNRPAEAETKFLSPEGAEVWWRIKTIPINGPDNQPTAFIELVEDITPRKKTEEKLRQSEENLSIIYQNATSGIVLTTSTGTYLYANPAFCQMVNYSLEELTGLTYMEITHIDDRKQQQALIEQLVNKEISSFQLEKRYVKGKTKEIVWARMNVSSYRNPQGEIEFLVGIIENITRTKEVEAEIRHRNRELTLLNRIIAISVTDLEPERLLDVACQELGQTFNFPLVAAGLLDDKVMVIRMMAEYQTGGWPSVLNEAIPGANQPLLKAIFRHKAPLVLTDVQNEPRLAQIKWIFQQRGLTSALLLPLSSEGDLVGVIVLCSVESHLFSSEEIDMAWSVAGQISGALGRTRLTQTRHHLSAAIEQTTESIVITDHKGIIIYVNPAFERVTGFNRAEVLGHPPLMFKHEQSETDFYRAMGAAVTTGYTWQGQLVNLHKNGTRYIEEAIISPVRNEQGHIVNYIAIKRNVTQEIQLEEQYRQAQKMEAVGRLAGGVAHDFNNLLTAIMGYAGLALTALPANHPAQTDLEGIKEVAEHAASLTRQLLTFARRQITEPKILNLNELILNLSKMLHRLIGEDIELTVKSNPNLGHVKADPGQLEQLLVNLVVNARDAMPGGGRLMIETVDILLTQEEAQQRVGVIASPYVKLTVSDTGTGMTEEVKTHLFEPFFTTKEAGKGTGLGLATCFGIVKQSGGHILVHSEVGVGTTFEIYLPSLEKIDNTAIENSIVDALPGGTETILLVEDDRTVRVLTMRLLKNHGYRLLEASNGEEALRLIDEQAQESIDLLLTDVVMPWMSGQELAAQVRKLRPEIKILYTSGYVDDTVAQLSRLEAEITLIPKPFSPELLLRTVRHTLDG